MQRNIWIKRCKCGKALREGNKSGKCRKCWINDWKVANYNGKKKIEVCSVVSVR